MKACRFTVPDILTAVVVPFAGEKEENLQHIVWHEQQATNRFMNGCLHPVVERTHVPKVTVSSLLHGAWCPVRGQPNRLALTTRPLYAGTNHNYCCTPVVLRRNLLRTLGWIRPGDEKQTRKKVATTAVSLQKHFMYGPPPASVDERPGSSIVRQLFSRLVRPCHARATNDPQPERTRMHYSTPEAGRLKRTIHLHERARGEKPYAWID